MTPSTPQEPMSREREEVPSIAAWQNLVKHAYESDPDGARVIEEITRHYNQMRQRVARWSDEVASAAKRIESLIKERDAALETIKEAVDLVDRFLRARGGPCQLDYFTTEAYATAKSAHEELFAALAKWKERQK